VSRESYTEEEKAVIMNRVSTDMESGMSFRQACAKNGVPRSTLAKWKDGDEDLGAQYARARERLLAARLNEIEAIVDEAEDIGRAKLQMDQRRWELTKLMPKRFGDKVRNEVSGPDGSPVQTVTRIERVIVDPAD
jgi:transposase-like protein